MGGDDEGTVTRRRASDWARSAYKIPVGEPFAGKYRIERILGSGGMGTVLRAHHIQLDQPVAIKVMHSELLAAPDTARRFALEARATAALKSPNVVRILDIDRLPSGVPFIVMELLHGMNLGSLVAERGPLSPHHAIHYLLQAADAIAEAHAHGIIHRDLKPHNMFLTDDGVVKVVDFGLAKALHPRAVTPESSMTATNAVLGSPHYMSPEQLLSGKVDERTDIWGLGATLYHLLAGVPPFPALNVHVLTLHITSHEPQPIAERRDDVSPAVEAVIARCLRKKPEDRYRSIAALQGALLHLRVQLQAGASRAASATAQQPLGATMPLSTLRDGAPRAPDADNAGTLPIATEPHPNDPATPAYAPGDDEPTQIDTSLDPSPGDLASTRRSS